jgi:hypothetical protein
MRTGYGVVGCSRSLPLSAERPEPHPDDPGLRDWRLDAGEGDQALLRVHHGGEEAFICLDDHLEGEIDGLRHDVEPGTFIVVPRGAVHTFATRRGAHVRAVMSPEIAELIDRLHEPMRTGDAQALWGRYHSSLA